MRKRGLDRMSLEDVVARLAAGEHLPPEYDNHRLRNPLHMHRVCRIDGGSISCTALAGRN